MPEHTWLISFTDAELEAIYSAIEGAPQGIYEDALQSVLDKITPDRISAPPAGTTTVVTDAMIAHGAMALHRASGHADWNGGVCARCPIEAEVVLHGAVTGEYGWRQADGAVSIAPRKEQQ